MGVLLSSRKSKLPTSGSDETLSGSKCTSKPDEFPSTQGTSNNYLAFAALHQDPRTGGVLQSVSEYVVLNECSSAVERQQKKFNHNADNKNSVDLAQSSDILKGRRMSIKDNPGLIGRLMTLGSSFEPKAFKVEPGSILKAWGLRPSSNDPSLMDFLQLSTTDLSQLEQQIIHDGVQVSLMENNLEDPTDQSLVNEYPSTSDHYPSNFNIHQSEIQSSTRRKYVLASSTLENAGPTQLEHPMLNNPPKRNFPRLSGNPPSAAAPSGQTEGERSAGNIPYLTRRQRRVVDPQTQTEHLTSNITMHGRPKYSATITIDPVRMREKISLSNNPQQVRYYIQLIPTGIPVASSNESGPSECRPSNTVGLQQTQRHLAMSNIPCLKRHSVESEDQVRTIGLIISQASPEITEQGNSISNKLSKQKKHLE